MPIGSDFYFSYLSASRQKVALLTSISLLDFLSFLDFQAPSMVLTLHGPMDFSIWICSLECSCPTVAIRATSCTLQVPALLGLPLAYLSVLGFPGFGWFWLPP